MQLPRRGFFVPRRRRWQHCACNGMDLCAAGAGRAMTPLTPTRVPLSNGGPTPRCHYRSAGGPIHPRVNRSVGHQQLTPSAQGTGMARSVLVCWESWSMYVAMAGPTSRRCPIGAHSQLGRSDDSRCPGGLRPTPPVPRPAGPSGRRSGAGWGSRCCRPGTGTRC